MLFEPQPKALLEQFLALERQAPLRPLTRLETHTLYARRSHVLWLALAPPGDP